MITTSAKVFVRRTAVGLFELSDYGPLASQNCSGGIPISAGAGTIQAAIAAGSTGDTFCLGSGTYSIVGNCTPKAGQTFVGKVDTIIDGSGWSTADATQAAFMGSAIDVTIRNMTIQNMPRKGINGINATGWLMEYLDVKDAVAGTGVSFPSDSTMNHCWLRGCPTGGYGGFTRSNIEMVQCRVSGNGREQKWVGTTNVNVRQSWFHDNEVTGVWYDTDNLNWIVEGCLCEDNGDAATAEGDGVETEISGAGIIRFNTIRRNRGHGVFIATSKNTQVYDNVVENNFRGIQKQLTVAAIGGGSIGWDLADNDVHGNTVTCPATADLASLGLPTVHGQAYCCTGTQIGALGDNTPYFGVDNSKGNLFATNTHHLPSNGTTPRWFFWPNSGGTNTTRNVTEWQALGQDVASTFLVP